MGPAFSKRALFFALSACFAGSALAAQGTPAAQSKKFGRPSASAFSAPLATINLGSISASFRHDGASFGSGAVGLRNRADGGIEVSGVTTPVKRALIYWAVITSGAPTSAVSNIDLKRGGVGATFTNIAGTVIGTGGTPCWLGDRVTVYRGAIPAAIATGNGLYVIRLKPGANGSTGGQDPWVISNPPLFEGASILMIGTGTATVTIYDVGLAGKQFFGQLSYQLVAPVSVTGSPQVLLLNAGADGQIGDSVGAVAATSSEITTLNGRRIAGPASPANDSDWNGGIAGPLPQLWDNTTHDVTTAARAGSSPTSLPIVISAPDDCVVPVVNVLSIRPAPPPAP